jgi:hypothetical protein
MGFTALDGWVFATIFLLSFALFLLITGVFTAYFGSGKSRKIGAGLLVTGLLIGIIIAVLRYVGSWGPGGTSGWFVDVIVQTIVVVLAVIIGAGLAIGLFLLAIMKS